MTNKIIDFLREHKLPIVVFLFSFAMMQGLAFTMFNNYTESMSPDALNYMKMAQGDFNLEPIQKYRVIIPMLAAGLDFVFGGVFEKIRPWSFEGDFSLFVSFWIVNTFVMALFSTVTYLLCRAYNISVIASLFGLLTIFSCRWTAYMAGLPIVDSLFCLTSVLVLLAIKTKDKGLLIFCILVGPWTKESFIFVAPVIFFFGPVKKIPQIGWFILSGLLVFSFRIYFDRYTNSTLSESFHKDFDHLGNFYFAVHRLFSFHGLYELFSIVGLWVLLPLWVAITATKWLTEKFRTLDKFIYAYLACVLVQAMISAELARMLYLALPVFALCIARLIDRYVSSEPGFSGLKN